MRNESQKGCEWRGSYRDVLEDEGVDDGDEAHPDHAHQHCGGAHVWVWGTLNCVPSSAHGTQRTALPTAYGIFTGELCSQHVSA